MRSKEEQLAIDDITQDHIGEQITLNNWIGALLISGVFIVLIAIMFYIGMFLGALVEWYI